LTAIIKVGLGLAWLMVFNTTFNNMSAMSWLSVLLVQETGVPGENHRPVVSPDKRYYIMLYLEFECTTLEVIDIVVNQLPWDHEHDGPLSKLRQLSLTPSC
jgi:hypothetical protein